MSLGVHHLRRSAAAIIFMAMGLGIRGQRNLVLVDDVKEGHALRHVQSLRIWHINTSDEEEL